MNREMSYKLTILLLKYFPVVGNFQVGMYGNATKNCVDMRVKIGDETVEYKKIPADVLIADFNNSGIVICETKDLVLNEVCCIKRNSESVLNSVEKHKGLISSCNEIIEELNPEVRHEAERQKEFESLKNDVSELKELLANFVKGGEKSAL